MSLDQIVSATQTINDIGQLSSWYVVLVDGSIAWVPDDPSNKDYAVVLEWVANNS